MGDIASSWSKDGHGRDVMPVDAAVQHLRWASGTDDPDATGPDLAALAAIGQEANDG